jgi:hypothetical protein
MASCWLILFISALVCTCLLYSYCCSNAVQWHPTSCIVRQVNARGGLTTDQNTTKIPWVFYLYTYFQGRIVLRESLSKHALFQGKERHACDVCIVGECFTFFTLNIKYLNKPNFRILFTFSPESTWSFLRLVDYFQYPICYITYRLQENQFQTDLTIFPLG